MTKLLAAVLFPLLPVVCGGWWMRFAGWFVGWRGGAAGREGEGGRVR